MLPRRDVPNATAPIVRGSHYEFIDKMLAGYGWSSTKYAATGNYQGIIGHFDPGHIGRDSAQRCR